MSRRVRLPVYATEEELARVRERAERHDVSASRFLLTSALGDPRSPVTARDAEEWWSGLSALRKRQIHRFLSKQMTPVQQCAGSEPLPFED